MSELKPRSFRIDDETLKKFQEIAQKIQGNQQHVLNELIETYEVYAAKEIISNQAENIDNFDGHIRTIRDMYMTSLNNNHQMEDIVRQKFKNTLDSKDRIIAELQNDIDSLKKEIENAEPERNRLKQENSDLENKIRVLTNKIESELEPQIKELEEENKHIDSLSESFKYVKNQIMDQNELQENLQKVTSEAEEQKLKNKELEKKLEDLSYQYRENVLALKEDYMNKINEQKESHIVELAKFQQKFQSYLDKQTTDQKQNEQKSKRTIKKSNAKSSASESVTENKIGS